MAISVVFRADASRTIGSGHVMRCLTLADALRDCGAAPLFVCREHDGHLCELIWERGFAVSRLPRRERLPIEMDGVAHAAWLDASWQDDAEGTQRAIDGWGITPEWLVVDHYALDHRWERTLRPAVGRIMAIDDLADRAHDCDLLLDQNFVSEMHSRYIGKTPAGCALLLGPDYALLQPIYAELRERAVPRRGPVRRLFVYFGAGDRADLTGRSLRAFLSLGRRDIAVDVVLSAGSPHEDEIRRQVEPWPNIHIHASLPTLAPLMAGADLAIGASGATSWERLCLGLPSIVITLAENQVAIAKELQERGLVRWLRQDSDVSDEALASSLCEEIEREVDANWSKRCLQAVDGRGVGRVCAAMTIATATRLHPRRATPADEALLLEWANDPTTRRTAFSPEPISAATHGAWFHARLEDSPGCRLFIVETDDRVALGQVRFERDNRQWEVHYALARVFRGRGLGPFLVEAAIRALRAEFPGAAVFGQVKIDNQPSRRVFERLGFSSQPSARAGVVVYQLEEGRSPSPDTDRPICR